jgi:hypothetical protein
VSDNMLDLSGWAPITCVESDEIREGMSPSSSLTDPNGTRSGMAVVYTEWVNPQTEAPVLRDYRWTEPGRDCEHYAPTEATR